MTPAVVPAIADQSSTTLPGTIGLIVAVLFVAAATRVWEKRSERRRQPVPSEPPPPPACSGDRNRCPGVGAIVVLAPGPVGLALRRVCPTHYLEGLILGYWPGRTNEPFDQEAATLAAEAEEYLRQREGRAS